MFSANSGHSGRSWTFYRLALRRSSPPLCGPGKLTGMTDHAKVAQTLRPYWGIIKPMLWALGAFALARVLWLYERLQSVKPDDIRSWLGTFADLLAVLGAGVAVFRLARKLLRTPESETAATSPVPLAVSVSEPTAIQQGEAESACPRGSYQSEGREVLCALYHAGGRGTVEAVHGHAPGNVVQIDGMLYRLPTDRSYETRYFLAVRQLIKDGLVEEYDDGPLRSHSGSFDFRLTEAGLERALVECPSLRTPSAFQSGPPSLAAERRVTDERQLHRAYLASKLDEDALYLLRRTVHSASGILWVRFGDQSSFGQPFVQIDETQFIYGREPSELRRQDAMVKAAAALENGGWLQRSTWGYDLTGSVVSPQSRELVLSAYPDPEL